MILKNILKNVKILENINFLENIDIKNIHFDSRIINTQSLFIAIKGTYLDGHNFIEKAIEKGSLVIVCEVLPNNINPNISYIKVKDSHEVLSIISSNFYDNPSEKINIIGVTGTNGKTTTTTLLYELFNCMGEKSGLISTIKIETGKSQFPTNNTTPDAITLNKIFAEMVNNGCKYCFMEVSSHGISQKRINNINFKGAIFTNITHEHLDYHGNFKNYINTKKLFFDKLPKKSFALSNIDDPNGQIMLQNTKANKYFYSLKSGNTNFKSKIIESNIGMQQIVIDGKELYTPLSGEFNVYNLTAVYSTAILCGMEKDNVLINLSKLKGITGRFETFISRKETIIIVDYAHTPDALENILSAINKNKNDKKIITIVGCGGNRDKTKRPIMGKIATDNSNDVIFTSDNPRNEDPRQIINDIEKGVSNENIKKYIVIENRKDAIKYACKIADNKTIILLAGKGHETYQELNGKKQEHNDMQIAKEYLEIFEK